MPAYRYEGGKKEEKERVALEREKIGDEPDLRRGPRGPLDRR